MKVLAILPQFDNKQRLGQSPAFLPANQMLKSDTVSFSGIKVPDETVAKEVRALYDEFLKHLNEIEDCYHAWYKKLHQHQKNAQSVTDDELAEAAKQFEESPNKIVTFLDNLKEKPKEHKDGFALYIDEDGEPTAHLALEGKHLAVADAFLDFVKTLDTPVQEKFATLANSNFFNHLHRAIYEGRPDFALEYIEFLKPLSEETRTKVFTLQDGDGNTAFNNTFSQLQTNVARKILESVKGLKESNQEYFTSLVNYDNKTHFQMALEAREPEIASDILEIAKGLGNKAKKVFITHKETGEYLPKEGISHFETAAERYPQIALDFLDFALDIAPKEIPSFKIPHNASLDFNQTTAKKVLACEKLEPFEKLTFLQKNNKEGRFDAMIAELEKQLKK